MMNIATQQQNETAGSAEQVQRKVQYVTPLADVESGKQGYTMRLEMPGVDKSGLEITLDQGELTILGHRHPKEISGVPVYREIQGRDFRRVYELDSAIHTAGITARLEDGVLTLTLPKAENVEPRKITVD
jgi:HSP20 family protein